MTDALTISGVRKYYTQRKKHINSEGKRAYKQIIKSVDGVDFTVAQGETLGIIGESGCGKSTLGRLIVGLESPTDGVVAYDGVNARDLLKQDRLAFRRKAQMIWQNPFDTFDPRHNLENILNHALKLHSIGNSPQERRDIALKALEDAGLLPPESFMSRFPHEFSGGQLQRISIIRAMLLKPRVVVADEPVSMLDVSIRADIINMLKEATEQQNTSLVFISHDISLTRYISDRIAVMYLGRVVEMGKAADIADNPMHPYTKVLISNCQSIDPRKKREPIRLTGEPPSPANIPPGCAFSARCPECMTECMKTDQQLTEVNGRLVRCMKIKS